MPAAGPYGITQFDAPGVIGMYQQAQENRIRSLILQKQMERADSDAKTQTGIRGAIDRYSNGGRPQPVSPSQVSPSDVPPEDRALLEFATPEALTGRPPAQPAQRQPEGDRQQLFKDLLALDPQVAGQVATALKGMDEAQASEVNQRNQKLGNYAFHILYDERGNPRQEADMGAIYQQVSPQLVEQGVFTQEQISGFQPTRENFLQVLRQAQDIEKLISITQPKLRNVGPMEVLIDERNPGAGPVYKSPVPKMATGPNGEMVLLEYDGQNGQQGDLPRVTDTASYEALPPGSQYVDPNGQTRTKGGQTGAPSGGFP